MIHIQKKIIDKASGNIERLYRLVLSCDGNREWLPYIEKAKNWIKEIKEDLEKNSIPKKYAEIIERGLLPMTFDHGDLSDSDIIDCIKNNPVGELDGINKHYLSLKEAFYQINSYHFYKQLGFARSNSVIVGANGCGKTSLANNLAMALNIKDGIVIPAQKFLIIPSFSSIPNFEATYQEYDNYQHHILDDKITYDFSKEGDWPYTVMQKYGDELRLVISMLIAEQTYKNNSYAKKVKNEVNADPKDLHSKLDSVLDIWNKLITHRFLEIDENNTLTIRTSDGNSYDAYKMSDGERILLYFTGRVLLAPEKALIIVDEPEGYLHESIINKLWDILEKLRSDCVFIYLTHDLTFASSRRGNKFWMKNFTYPDNWEIVTITENEIPESLLMEILGSRKDILFCEGDNTNSLDTKIYEIIFSEFTIIPVHTCKDVIAYTRAFNKIQNRNSKAFGIVDRDFREEKQIEKLKSESIFVTDVAEIENFFLTESFIRAFAKAKNEKIDMSKIKEGAIKLLQNSLALQASLYVSGKINFFFSQENVSKGKNIEEIRKHFDDFISKVHIDDWYNERIQLLEDLIKDKNYEQIIKVYNNKGLHTVVEKVFGYASNQYRQKALDFLSRDTETQTIFKRLFPDFVTTT